MNDYYYLQMLTKKREENIHKFPHTKLHQAHSCFSLFFFWHTTKRIVCIPIYAIYVCNLVADISYRCVAHWNARRCCSRHRRQCRQREWDEQKGRIALAKTATGSTEIRILISLGGVYVGASACACDCTRVFLCAYMSVCVCVCFNIVSIYTRHSFDEMFWAWV